MATGVGSVNDVRRVARLLSREGAGPSPRPSRWLAFWPLGLRPCPAAVHRLVEDPQPPVEQLWRERVTVVKLTMMLDVVDLVVGCIEDDAAPVVGDGADLGLPVDEPGAEVK